MDKNYNHLDHEEKIYSLWEQSGAFSPKATKTKKSFTIIMPPPNANDPLHIGHARFVAIEDILIRYHRMKGESTLWIPGSDHAGIETQFVFEKKLKEKGQSRFDFDRDTLYKMIWDYVKENTGVMETQLRKLGASCDWTRFKFTLDPEIIKIVYGTFKKLFDDGLIYRGERMINYCPRCGTAFSQLEVDFVERDDNLYYLDYGPITIATTRPETIFADVAVAVNPKDKKYKELIGKTAIIPLINREIPIIADSLAKADFGTGAVKVTPAHDPVDFEIGQKHSLLAMSVIDENGRMTGTPEKYIGMKVEPARAEVVKDLETAGKIVKTEKIHHSVGTCYRDKGMIEPRISKQWFLKVEPLANSALAKIKDKSMKFAAKKYEKIAIHWLKNLKDWNISRQIVWGIRIPAYRCDKCLEWTITDSYPPESCRACNHTSLSQDTDTFDTWFSSGQWPFAVMKASKNNDDFDYFYPTSVMNTGYDILPFWVIRMIMLGVYETGSVPFKDVVLHGLVRDREGQKISKSKGNVINPIEMSEIYGSDALRVSLVWGANVENDIALFEDNIRGQRNFANKIWNIARFVTQSEVIAKKGDKNEDDDWIKKELSITIKKVSKCIDTYKLNEAIEEIYEFIWHKFADVYIEKTKNRRESAQETLLYILKSSLVLLHPFMPFVSEVIWQQTKEEGESNLIEYPWPKS